MRLPSYAEADALAIALEAMAADEAATAVILKGFTGGDPSHAVKRAVLLKRAAEGWRWLANHSDRLGSIGPVEIKRSYNGGKR